MEFYPITFNVDKDIREVHTQLTGKKIALSDHQVNIRGVMCEQFGIVTDFDAPKFTLERYSDGYTLKFDRELEQTLTVVLEAQGNGGQLTRAELFLHVGPEPVVKEVESKPVLGPTERYKAIVAMGVEPEDALKVIKNKLGDAAEAEVKSQMIKELTA